MCKTAPDEPAGRSSAPESGSCALTRRRVGFRLPEKNIAWIGFWLRCFEKSCWSPLYAPDDVVGVGKYRRKEKKRRKSFRKISPEKCWWWWGFSDHDMADWKALGDGKSDRNEIRSLDGFPELITRVNQKE